MALRCVSPVVPDYLCDDLPAECSDEAGHETVGQRRQAGSGGNDDQRAVAFHSPQGFAGNLVNRAERPGGKGNSNSVSMMRL